MCEYKIAAYARYSSDKQRPESIDEQNRRINDFASRLGLEVIKYYHDDACTGTDTDRPQYQEMMAEIRKGTYNAIICFSIDRIHRNTLGGCELDNLIRQNKLCIFEAVSGDVYDNRPGAHKALLSKIVDGVSYSDNLSQDVLRGKEENMINQKFNGGVAPYGYKIVNFKYVINPKEAPAVRILFTRYINGDTLKNISKELQNKGYLTRNGKRFPVTTLHDMLCNEVYTGCYVHRKTISVYDGIKRKKGVKNIETNVYKQPNSHAAIISTDTFLKAKQRMERTKEKGGRPANIYTYPLNNKVFCSCGAPMRGNRRSSKGSTYIAYSCTSKEHSSSVHAEALTKAIMFNIFDPLFAEPEILTSCVNNYVVSKAQSGNKKLKKLQNRLKRIKSEKKNLIALAAKYGDDSDIDEELISLRKEEAEICLELSQYDNNFDIITSDDIIKIIPDFYDKLLADPESLAMIIEASVDRIVVDDEYATVYYKPHYQKQFS